MVKLLTLQTDNVRNDIGKLYIERAGEGCADCAERNRGGQGGHAKESFHDRFEANHLTEREMGAFLAP